MSNEELAVLAQQDNREAIEGLWEQVKRLLYQLARRFYRRYGLECCAQHGVTMADLEQECFLALLDAVRGFKSTGGVAVYHLPHQGLREPFQGRYGLAEMQPPGHCRQLERARAG